MTGLNQFLNFDFAQFCQGKRFVATATKAWVDPKNNNQHLGSVVTVAIVEDKTPYAKRTDGKAVSNLFEKMNWKIARDVNIPVGAQVVPVGGVATVYGEFRDHLTARVTDIKVVQPSAPANAGKGLN